MKKKYAFPFLKKRRWLLGTIKAAREKSWLVECYESKKWGVIPKCCRYSMRSTTIEGVTAFVIDKKFDDLENFKALNFSEVQGLLKNDTVGTT